MAVYNKSRNFIDYCHKIQKLCRTEYNSPAFSKKLIEILKNLNEIKQKSKLRLSIYLIDKSDEE
ncbi:MAG: hypothetical protein R3255_09355 [Candidatus Lokiarchaeia archaeon]|nr:hypothetical protein [Candidatus Lokiarchaeia archaeon]